MNIEIKKLHYISLIALPICILYGLFLWNPIEFDDLAFFMVDNAGHQPVSDYHFSLFKIRSLPYATLAWTKAVFGLDLIYFRIGNLILHSATCIALFGFLSEVFVSERPQATANQQTSAQGLAFFSATLFALHPVASYAAGYLVQRTIVLATLFSILAMWSYVYGSKHKRLGFLWFTLPLYYLAVFSKEHAITLFPVFIVLTIYCHSNWGKMLLQRMELFVGFLIVAVFAILARKGIFGEIYEVSAKEMIDDGASLAYPLSVVTQSWLFFKYVFLWLMPNPSLMSIDMREGLARTFFSHYLFGVVAYLTWGATGLWLLMKRGSNGLLGLALLYPWIMFFTEFTVVRVQEPFVLYRSYLWAIGFSLAIPAIFGKVKAKTTFGIFMLCVLIYFPVSMERLATMSHPILLWDDAEKLVANRKDLPGVYRIYYNRGTEYLKIDAYDKSAADLKQSVILNPKFAEAYGNLGVAFLKMEHWDDAIVAFSKAIEITNKTGMQNPARYYQGRAEAFAGGGDLEKSKLNYRESCRLGARSCDKAR